MVPSRLLHRESAEYATLFLLERHGCVQGYYGPGERMMAQGPVPNGYLPGPMVVHLPYLPPPQAPQQPYYGYYPPQAPVRHPPVAPSNASVPSPVPEAPARDSCPLASEQSGSGSAPVSRVFRLPWLKKSSMAVDPASKRKICFCT